MQKSGMQKTGAITRQWITVVAVLMAIAINALSNFFPPRGQNIGEVSDTILGGVLITPEGYAFAIWGLIYLGLITYSVYQALPAQRDDDVCAHISWLLVGACILQMLWVLAFLLYQFWLSVGLMLGILVCLWMAYLRSRTVKPTARRRWLLQSPISVYFGWITVAAVVNVASALHVMQATGTASDMRLAWAIPAAFVLMLVSAGIAGRVAMRHGDAAYPAVVTWALSAIAVRHAGSIPLLSVAGVLLSVLLSLVMVHIVATGKGRSQAMP
ncbi:MAG: tryptophan-rich sensory protein [Phormidesmis sp.]